MKGIFSTLTFLILSVVIYAQNETVGKLQPIKPHRIEISDRVTTVLIFPWAIKDVDRGIKEIGATRSAGMENILRIKAKQSFIDTSNLHVITSDGIIYPFAISYTQAPEQTTFKVNLPDSTYSALKARNSDDVNSREIDAVVQQIRTKGQRLNRRAKNGFIVLFIKGIFIKDNLIFLKTEIVNRTNAPFEVDWAKIFITDRKDAKNTSKQSVTIDPIYKDELPIIAGKGRDTWIIACKQRSVVRGRKMQLEIQEKNGGRNLTIEIRNKDLYSAQKL